MSDSPELKREKRALRESILRKRDALSEEERTIYSEKITEIVLRLPEMRQSRHVLCYMDFRSEVKTGQLIDECVNMGKMVWIPRVADKHTIAFYRFTGRNALVRGRWGIQEPSEDDTLLFDPEKALREGCFAVIPGTVFDTNCGRIGYSGGFYDRFLTKFPDIFTCGVCFSCQIAESVPLGEFDVRMDMVVTEREIYRK